MSDETTLLPCPFCGGEADEYEGDYGNGICCMMCGAMVGEPIHLEYMTTKRVSIDEAIAAWNARAERGTLTAEQVREAVEASTFAETSTIREFNDSSWQAIADELNATLGGGECECVWNEQEGTFRCSSCDTLLTNEISIEWPSYKVTPITLPNYCPNCGKAVKR